MAPFISTPKSHQGARITALDQPELEYQQQTTPAMVCFFNRIFGDSFHAVLNFFEFIHNPPLKSLTHLQSGRFCRAFPATL
jgi:hypothetical protein